MERNEFKKSKKYSYTHDFMKDRTWVFFVEGFSESKSAGYMIYILSIFVFFISLLCMSAYGAYKAAPIKELIIDALHVFMICTFAIWCLITRFVTEKSLYKTREIINSGFYHYEDEDLDHEQMMMQENVVAEVKRRSKQFLFIFVSGGVSNLFFFPISQYILVTDEEYENMIGTANPYLPLYFHLPFSTRGIIGLSMGFFVNILVLLYIYGMAVVTNEIFISTVIQLKTQLQILNHSIKNIHQRAFKMYHKYNNNYFKQELTAEMYDDAEFHRCLYKCLRSNVEHHQLLLR